MTTPNDRPSSWLLPAYSDRERMLDMDRRLKPYRQVALGLLAVALVAMGPWIGFWTLVPLVAVGLMFKLAERRTGGGTGSELLIFTTWVTSQTMIAVSLLLAGADGLPLLAWLAIPVVSLSARFSLRGIALGVGITLALLVAVTFLTDTESAMNGPVIIITPAAVVIAVAILSSALMRSDVDHRGEAVIDPLTGMLNRKALAGRIDELRQQAQVTGAPVGLIMVDIDHFKRINDTVGHATGDAVLRDLAYIIRKQMRAFELAYRLGGEEFLVLLPGTGGEDAARLAERIRVSVAAAHFAEGVEVRVSCGVSASLPGEELDFDARFAAADAALYEAKESGRNRVVGASGVALQPMAT